jgi:hypothetical protein
MKEADYKNVTDPQYCLIKEYAAAADRGMNRSEEVFRAILAYLEWQDGADWEFVEEVWFKDPYWTREVCIKELAEKFDYGLIN